MKSIPIWITGLFLFYGLPWGGLGANCAEDKAPDFALIDLNGNTVTLEQYRGKVVILDFWATWCFPCRSSIPELVRLQKEFRPKGVQILGISLDHPKHTSDQALKAFAEKFRINYPVLRGNEKIKRDYFGSKAPKVPFHLVLDREGRIVEKQVGFVPGALEKSVRKVLSTE